MRNNRVNDVEQGNEAINITTPRLKKLGFIPVPAFMVIITVLYVLDVTTVFEPFWLLPFLNILLGATVALLVATGAARLYLYSGSIGPFLLGCGNLSFGLGYLFAGWFINLPAGQNTAVTMHDTGALLGSFFHIVGILFIYIGTPPEQRHRRRMQKVILAYLGVLVFMVLLSITSFNNTIPIFFIQGVGATPADQMVLGLSVVFYAITAFLFMRLHARAKIDFLYWYSLALGLMAVGLAAVLIQTSVGSPIGWIGRSAKYLGHIYFLFTVIVAGREFRSRGISVERGMIGPLRHRLETLVEEHTGELTAANEQLRQQITECKRTEEELGGHVDIINFASSAITTADIDGRMASYNPTFLEMWGFDEADQILGRPFSQFWEVSDQLDEIMRALFEQGIWKGELKAKKKDGSLFDVQVSAATIYNQAGKPIRLMSSSVDITKHRQAEEALRESEAQYKRLVEGSPDIVYQFSDKRGGIYYSPSVEDVLGYSISHLLTHPFLWHDSVHPDDLTKIDQIIADFTLRKMFGIEYRIIDAWGEWHWFYNRTIGWRVIDDEIIIEGVVTDITERKRVKDELQKAYDELDHRVEKRTAELAIANTRLKTEIVKHKHAEEEKARLLESVSRQREQLVALTGQLAEVQENERKQLSRELHDRVGRNLTALSFNLASIRTQLSTPAPDTGQLLTSLKDSQMLVEQTTEHIRNVMANLRPPMLDDYGLVAVLRWYSAKFTTRVNIAIDVDGEKLVSRLTPPIENTLFRITQEALTNIAKYSRATQVTITVIESNEVVRLIVADNGIGFEPVHPAEIAERPGWGLITMTERARAIGGLCRVESTPGVGTKVIVEVGR